MSAPATSWLILIAGAIGFLAIERQTAPASEARTACLEYVQETLGRRVQPQRMQTWPATDDSGAWLVEANYTDNGIGGTLWCQLRETTSGLKRVSIHNRAADARSATAKEGH